MNKLLSQIGLLQSLNISDLIGREHQFAVAERGPDEGFELVDSLGDVLLEQGDALTHALDALRLQFLMAGRNGMEHIFHIGVVEHGGMDDATAWKMIECRAAHLAVANQYVVVSGACGFNSELP